VTIAAGVVVLALAALWWQRSGRDVEARIVGQQAPLPRATAESEFLAPAALEAARAEAARQGFDALVVHRHGHRVFEYFASGRDGSVELDGGELAAAVLELTLLESGEAGPGDAMAEAGLVAERLWQPLR